MSSDEKKRYEVTCPECGETVFVCKSLGMEIGFVSKGIGTCVKCYKMIGLDFDFEKQEMSAKKLEKPHKYSEGGAEE